MVQRSKGRYRVPFTRHDFGVKNFHQDTTVRVHISTIPTGLVRRHAEFQYPPQNTIMMMKTHLAIGLVVLAVLTKNQVSGAAPIAYDGDDSYGETGEYGGEGSYDGYGEGSSGGYGGYGGWHGYKRNDVEMFLSMRNKLIQAATNAVGFSQFASLNRFNGEALGFPYRFPGKLSFYVRELEKVPPYYKYDYLYNKAPRHDDDDMH
uniref:Uncharacterized protein n=1 Tax=Anopheles culicifacies TaxID=139723 RepID=A0A182MHC6_9DIPT